MSRAQIQVWLYGSVPPGVANARVRATLLSSPTRTLGLIGDPVTVLVDAPEFEAADFDLTDEFRVAFGTGDPEVPEEFEGVVLGGYRLVSRPPLGFAWERDADPETDPPITHQYQINLQTIAGFWRDGRGGLIQEGTLNRLGVYGQVDVESGSYRTNQQLADICLDYIGHAHDPAPASLNTGIDGVTVMVAPGPLDWGNTSAVNELDALLARLGYSARLSNAGDKITIVRLARAGETITIPGPMLAVAEPYELAPATAVRPSELVITSGRTRCTVTSSRTLTDDDNGLVWCSFDEELGLWVDEADAGAMLEAFQTGPAGDLAQVQAFAKSFAAVRLSEDIRPYYSRFVTLPQAPATDPDRAFGGAPCMVFATGCVAEKSGQFANLTGVTRIDGARAIPGEGVFVLPRTVRFVKMTASRGSYANAAPLVDDELTIYFTHESDTGSLIVDYYVSGWKADVDEGVISVVKMSEGELSAAVLDPMVAKLEAPYLRMLAVWAAGEPLPEPTNKEALDLVAQQIALARISDAEARSGLIELKGMLNIEPGDWGGAITAVRWDLGRNRTVASVAQHEAPASFWYSIEQQAKRSIGAGWGRHALPGSSAAVSDVRAGSSPGDLAGVYGGADSGVPEASAGTRGRESATVFGPKKSAAPEPGSALPSVAEGSEVEALITGTAGVSSNRWTYTWQEAKWDGSNYAAVVGGMSSATHGLARNRVEFGNDGDGEESPGWNVASDDPDQLVFLSIKPIKSGTPVTLTRRALDGDPTWFFALANAVEIDTEPVGTVVRRLKARITGSTVFDDNEFRWLYDWEELEHTDGGWAAKLGGLTSGGTIAYEFTADAETDKITPEASMAAFPNGASVRVTTTDTLPAPLATGTDYYGRWTAEGAGPYTLYPTLADALANTNAIDLTTAGSGVHTLTRDLLSGGKALNFTENGNPTSGKVAPGITLATLNAGFALQPIMTGTHVEIEGPYVELDDGGAGEGYTTRWYFRCENVVDGECSP